MPRSYTVISSRPATRSEIADAQRRAELIDAQLPSVRASAQNWRNGVGLGTLASGFVGLLTAPEIVQSASDRAVTNGGWILLIATVVAVISLALAMRASFGWPKAITLTGKDSLREWTSNELSRTVFYLRASMILTLAALTLYTMAFSVLIFHVESPIDFTCR